MFDYKNDKTKLLATILPLIVISLEKLLGKTENPKGLTSYLISMQARENVRHNSIV